MNAMALPELRAGFDDTGTGRWLMRVVQHFGLDEKHGFRLDLSLAREGAGQARPRGIAALAADQVDVVDADWLSISRNRREGHGVTGVFPYGRIMGTVVARPDSGITGIDGLRCARLGVIGMEDKNWSVLRAWCRSYRAFDPAGETEVWEAGSRQVLVDAVLGGHVDAALVHWHLVPRLTADGCVILAEIPDLVRELSGSDAPTTFFVFRDDLVARQPGLVGGFVAAVREAVGFMREESVPWFLLARELPTPDAACLPALRRRWLNRICTRWDAAVVHEVASLQQLLAAWDDGFAGQAPLVPGTLSTSFMH